VPEVAVAVPELALAEPEVALAEPRVVPVVLVPVAVVPVAEPEVVLALAEPLVVPVVLVPAAAAVELVRAAAVRRLVAERVQGVRPAAGPEQAAPAAPARMELVAASPLPAGMARSVR
jgi:hypothetical protein